MDMNQFRNYLSDINNSLNAPQKGLSPIYEGKKMKEGGKMYEYGKGKKMKEYNEDITPEDVVREYLSSFFGGELNEDTSDEAIFEAVDTLNIICHELTEYFLSEEDIEPSDIVTESLDAIFGDDLNEDTSDEDVVSILEGLNAVTMIVNEYFEQE